MKIVTASIFPGSIPLSTLSLLCASSLTQGAGESNALQYIKNAERILDVLYIAQYAPSTHELTNILDPTEHIELNLVRRSPSITVLEYAKRVVSTLNQRIFDKHQFHACICQKLNSLNQAYQLMRSYSRTSAQRRTLFSIEKEIVKQLEISKSMHRHILCIGMLLDQWVQNIATMLNSATLSEWLTYCKSTLSPEAFEDLLNHCANQYAQENTIKAEHKDNVMRNYRAYLHILMKTPTKTLYHEKLHKNSLISTPQKSLPSLLGALQKSQVI